MISGKPKTYLVVFTNVFFKIYKHIDIYSLQKKIELGKIQYPWHLVGS